MNIINELKGEWKKKKLKTGFFLIALIISLLSLFKPSYTETIWGYLGISAFNLGILGGIFFLFWWFYLRKK